MPFTSFYGFCSVFTTAACVPGCGVAFGLYYLLAMQGPWKMSALRVAEGATLVEN